MNLRRIVRITVLVLAAAAVTLSCTFDYWLDFAITETEVIDNQLIVHYSMINKGDRSVNNASINIQVADDPIAGTPEQYSEWLPIAGVHLAGYGGSYSDTYTFLFNDPVDPSTVEVEILGSRWDEYTSSY